ncbi:MAG: HAD hydrolase-like protein [Acidimicrobiales bacterium]
MTTAVLLDLDGTITDPAQGIFNSVVHALDRLGKDPLGARELRSFIGPPLRQSFARVGVSEAEIPAAIAAYREHFATDGLFENELYPGIEIVLGQIAEGTDAVAVATSKPTVFAARILEHFALDGYFDAIVGAELDGRRSAKAEVISEALRQLDANPADCVMVGDREHDVIGAAAHGIPCVGVAWGYAEPGELAAAGAHSVIEHLSDLPAAIVNARS